jgi:formamidopyrimidine-DNA glycosylase
MPELPEVETLRRSLEQRVLGKSISDLVVADRRLRVRIAPEKLRAALVGRTIASLGRRSKYLLVQLSDGQVLVVHLGMSGRLVLERADAPLLAHTHVRVRLDGAGELRFTDPRRFGMFFVVAADRLDRHPRFRKLGPEPFGPDFTLEYLNQRATGVRKPIKNFLMDAAVVVGVGNIYACESLYRAGIHPTTPARRIRADRLARLHRTVLEVLHAAVGDGGTTLQDFRDGDGRYGAFQHRLSVYGRVGEPCRRCGRNIRRIVQAGRSTFYCPGCQH